MSKKGISLWFLTLAYAILLGHNIIPHHHHENELELTEHHSRQHQHDGQSIGQEIGHLFSHFLHVDDGLTFTANHANSLAYSKQQISFVAVLPFLYAHRELRAPPLWVNPPAERPVIMASNSPPSGLRAPPNLSI